MHKPVLLNEVLAALDPHPGDFMVDGTLDGGGHAEAIIKKIMPGGTLLGVDWDEAMIAETGKRLHARCVHGNYADLPEILARERLPKADGLLLDLGFSSEQLEASGRGFSFRGSSQNEPLLMTYDPSRRSVAEIVREESEASLADIIFQYGGERRSRQIAKAIKLAGKKKRIVTSGELADAVRSALPGNYEHGRIDPATRTFQALRIYANGELENLARAIGNVGDVLKPGGRIAIISFHSLEDRIVKQQFQTMAKEKKITIGTKKPITASREEVRENPAAGPQNCGQQYLYDIHSTQQTKKLHQRHRLYFWGFAILAGTFWLVVAYNQTVNVSHNIEAMKAQLDSIGAQNTAASNEIIATLGGDQASALAAQDGLVQENNPQYVTINNQWPIVSR